MVVVFKHLLKIIKVFLYPLKIVWGFLFKKIVVPVYKYSYSFKGIIKRQKDVGYGLLGMVLRLVNNKYTLYFSVLLFLSFVLINNFDTKTVAAEDLGKDSLLYKIAAGNEFEEIVEENSFIVEIKEEAEKEGAKVATSTDANDLMQNVVSKDELNNSSVATSSLQALASAGGVGAETVNKSGSTATLSAPEARGDVVEYTVQSGDVLSTIAEKFGISLKTLLWANDLSGLSVIRPGDKLTILPVSGVMHKVESGDTLSAIANKYEAEIDEILSFNNIVSEDQLSVGQKLVVPGGEVKRTVVKTQSSSSYSPVVRAKSSQSNQGGFIWPTVSRVITQYYHWSHHGLDIGGRLGSPLYAAMGGTVTRAGWGTGYGNYVLVDHGGGRKTLYAHMNRIYVKRGQIVAQGDVLGELGTTGWSTGPHLHFEVIINGVKLNPLSYL